MGAPESGNLERQPARLSRRLPRSIDGRVEQRGPVVHVQERRGAAPLRGRSRTAGPLQVHHLRDHRAGKSFTGWRFAAASTCRLFQGVQQPRVGPGERSSYGPNSRRRPNFATPERAVFGIKCSKFTHIMGATLAGGSQRNHPRLQSYLPLGGRVVR
jgi:hypothetical protein